MNRSQDRYMEEFSVEELISKFNFYVPEIQREYVWGKNNKEILSVFCDDIIEARKKITNEENLQKENDKILKLLEDSNIGTNMNIGFLYSYKPNYSVDYMPDDERHSDTYLIDGQQRFTTLFLLLFYISVKENKLKEFKDLFRFDFEHSSLAFDYRVRALTHDFVINLIGKIDNLNKFKEIQNLIWYIQEYDNDPTISAMVNALNIIDEKFKEQDDEFYSFILSKIKFWHFKTEKTNQGEELYITMNSRGMQLQDNETLRAKLFADLESKEQQDWSVKWEEWQDFFWKNRTTQNSADKGFNEFLKCIAGLKNHLNSKTKLPFVDNANNIYDTYLYELTLHDIKLYFDNLMFLFDNSEQFKKSYNYSNWVDQALSEIKKIILKDTTNWFVDYTNPNKATERQRMVYIWSILHFIKRYKEENSSLDIDVLYRLLRIYWLRYNNLDRRVKDGIKDRIDIVIQNGLWKEATTEEEEVKHKFFFELYQNDNNELRKYENIIWEIEDHPLNINGYQVKNINSSHLIDYNSISEPDELNTIYNKFITLFPLESKESDYNITINNILLFYGFYGFRRSPHYYENYDFGSWRRIVRDLDSNDKQVFASFFNDFDCNNLNDIYRRKKKEFLKGLPKSNKIQADELIDALRFYAIVLDAGMWKKGEFIATGGAKEELEEPMSPVSYETDYNGIVGYNVIYNTSGSFRGYNNMLLYKQLPSDFKDKLESKK